MMSLSFSALSDTLASWPMAAIETMTLNDRWNLFLTEVDTIFRDGGYLMVPLVIIAVLIYYTGFEVYYYFSRHNFWKMSQEKINSLVANPVNAEGEVRKIIDYSRAEVESQGELMSRFAEIKTAYLAYVDRRRTFMMILIKTAPLTGLLGTVAGMLKTFSGLAQKGGGETIDKVASGISEALITTQTGLIIAIPAYVLAWFIQKRRNSLEVALTHMESVSLQLYEKNALHTES